MTRAVRFAAIASLVFLSVSTFAASCPLSGSPLPCYMNFYGAKDMQLASSFYNGGGIPTTPNYGVTFSSNVIVLLPFSAGGSGQFAPTLTDPLNGVAYLSSRYAKSCNCEVGDLGRVQRGRCSQYLQDVSSFQILAFDSCASCLYP
jgi:hypothetical protein